MTPQDRKTILYTYVFLAQVVGLLCLTMTLYFAADLPASWALAPIWAPGGTIFLMVASFKFVDYLTEKGNANIRSPGNRLQPRDDGQREHRP